MSQDDAKKLSGIRAIDEFVQDGMKLGLGSGTTSHFFVRELGKRVAEGLKVTCTTTSRSTNEVAQSVGIEIIDPNQIGEIDLTIDGPDEIDRNFNMIKGGGACLLWEKIIAHASKRMITVCDESKIVETLGAFPLPIEVVQFGWKQTEQRISDVLNEHVGSHVKIIRRHQGEKPVITDSGHFILDCHCQAIPSPAVLETALNMIPGVVENGLFTRESNGMVVGRFDGTSFVVTQKASKTS
ncbi:ribose 5-phosphate isomerase A [Vibrio nigripulchritudo]|uniref:ribose 5-phosphate isomerase A n=1 Tax=Vibrio nigripulchritudo TaxID=28173 RepID=UPI002491D8F8|nr:ribose 5-phosphate isomerase A [Vibrio nigripulchritudo]BDU37375.1 ribose-5-phosphate isomerase A 2 [Vibrio nigripulchritudo]BDU43097.1 ribose-5-phosphate isomerase A 2 [Vibrio nigripulchritudo]